MLEYSLNKVDTVIRDLAKKYNLPVPIVENAVKFPFELTVEAMNNMNIDRPIYHLHMGRFVVKPNRLKYMQEGLSDDHPFKIKGDNTRLEESSVEGQGDGEDSSGESC